MTGYVCECDDDTCRQDIPAEAWDELDGWRDEHNSALYLVHEDHIDGDLEIHRSGSWVLVQDASGMSRDDD